MNHSVFFYGTLMSDRVFKAVAGYKLIAEPAMLRGFQIYSLKNRLYPGIIPSSQGLVNGLVCTVNADALEKLDWFEGNEYYRAEVTAHNSENADLNVFTYVLKDEIHSILLNPGWDFDRFIERDLDEYLS